MSEQAKRVIQCKRTSKRCKRMSEWTSEWPSTSLCILGYSGPQYLAPLLPHPPLRLRWAWRQGLVSGDAEISSILLSSRPLLLPLRRRRRRKRQRQRRMRWSAFFCRSLGRCCARMRRLLRRYYHFLSHPASHAHSLHFPFCRLLPLDQRLSSCIAQSPPSTASCALAEMRSVQRG